MHHSRLLRQCQQKLGPNCPISVSIDSEYSDRWTVQFESMLPKCSFVHLLQALHWAPHHLLPSSKELCDWGRDPQEGYRTLTDHNQVQRDSSRLVRGSSISNEVWRGLRADFCQVYIHPASALYQRNPEWIVYHELVPILANFFRYSKMKRFPLWLKWCSSCCCWGPNNPEPPRVYCLGWPKAIQ